jgi:hypothetical protein
MPQMKPFIIPKLTVATGTPSMTEYKLNNRFDTESNHNSSPRSSFFIHPFA